MQKQNILILCHELTPIGGGAGNFTKYLSEDFGKRDKFSKIVVITSNYRGKYPSVEKDGKIEIYRLPIFRRYVDRTGALDLVLYTLFAFAKAITLSLKYKFDFTLAVHGIPSGPVAFLLLKFRGIPYGVSLRGGDIPGFLPQKYSGFHKKISFITKAYWQRATFITFNISAAYELAKDLANKLSRSTHVIPNGVDCDFFVPPQKRDFRTINIVYSGRLTEQKNVGAILKAIHALINKPRSGQDVIPVKVNIAGDGDLRKDLEGLIAKLNLNGCVRLYGWLDKEKLRLLYQSSHIFILPSLYEGMSNSLLEALACGLAVISTDFKGYDALVRDGENGYLIKSNDLNCLSEKMLLLLKNPFLIEKMGIKSRERVLNFSWQSVGEKYFNLITNS